MQDFVVPVTMELGKASKEDEQRSRIPIRIVASDPSPDRVNDSIVLKAFDDAKDSFLKVGCIDYDHQTVRGKTKLDQAQGVIGKPLELSTESGEVVCEGFLHKGNPFVDTALFPALRAGSNVFGASVGGRILRKSMQWDDDAKRKVNRITAITLNHIAVTPQYKAVHPSTSIALAKSLDEDSGLLIFGDFGDFTKSFAETTGDEELDKALVAGTQFESDVSKIRGGPALQPQSLEGAKRQGKTGRKKKKKDEEDEKVAAYTEIFDDLLKALSDREVKPSYYEVEGWLSETHGLSPKSAREIIEVFVEDIPRVRVALAADRQ